MESANDPEVKIAFECRGARNILARYDDPLLSWDGPANAAAISFIEDPAGIAPLVANTDIAGATIATSVESASRSVGNVTGPSTLLLKRAMTNQGTMTMEGGGVGLETFLN